MRHICPLVFLLAFFEEPTIAGEPRKLKPGKKGKKGKIDKKKSDKSGSKSSNSDDDKDYFPNPFRTRTCDEKCKGAAQGEQVLNVTTSFQVDTGKIYDFFNTTIYGPPIDNTVVGGLATFQEKMDGVAKDAKATLDLADANVAKAEIQLDQAQAQVRPNTYH